jgi:hypothetical protein
MRLPWKFILVSFIIGVFLGGSVGLYYSHDLARHWLQKGPEMFLRKLDNEIHLTDSQRTQIHTLLDVNRDKMAAYQDEIRKAARAQIRPLLSPEQQTRFDAMIAKHDAERRKREGR